MYIGVNNNSNKAVKIQIVYVTSVFLNAVYKKILSCYGF